MSSATDQDAVGVVVTSYRQADQVREAVESVLAQTHLPAAIVVVDDGSPDESTHAVLAGLDPLVTVVRQTNAGVAAARNRGVLTLDTPYVAVLDGDDRWEPTFLAQTIQRMEADETCVAASSWMQMFGVANHLVRPTGGTVVDFLHHNACAASAVFRRTTWTRVGGYRESMRHGFEDWDFFLGALEPGGRIDIVPAPLLNYRTHPTSLNITSMTGRLERFAEIITSHQQTYQHHLLEVILALETTSLDRLARWEELMLTQPEIPVPDPSFGDGGMAAAVRLALTRNPC